MRKLLLAREASQFLESLDAKRYRQIVRKVFSLAENATPNDAVKLQGSEYLRADQGEFRIVYRFDVDTVYIDIVGKRNDDEVYSKLERKRL